MAEKLPGSEMTDLNKVEITEEERALFQEINRKEQQEAAKSDEPFPCGGDTTFFIEDVAKWKGLTNFLVPYIEVTPWKDVEKTRPIFEDAYAKAAKWFEDRGALAPVSFPGEDAIEAHLHPNSPHPTVPNAVAPQIVFLFKRRIAGLARRECAIPYILSPDQVGWLKATGRWPKGSPQGGVN